MSKQQPIIKPNSRFQITSLVTVLVLVACVGVYLLMSSRAASPYVTSEAESGTLSSGATVVNSSAASSGAYVQFGASAAVLPTPTSLDATYTTLAFDDEFPGTTLSTTKWETCVWYTTCNTAGDIPDRNGGTEDPANVSVDNGLSLSATSSDPTDAQSWGDGWIDSAPYYQTPAGNYYVEIKAKLPAAAPGLWPAFVLYQDTDLSPSESYAEMDILERVSVPESNGTVNPDTAYQSWHPASGASTSNEIGGSGIDLTGWNTYGAEVSSTGSIQYWFNGSPTGSAIAGGTNAIEKMFISLAITTGGTPDDGYAGVPTAATPSPSTINVAYVRVFTP